MSAEPETQPDDLGAAWAAAEAALPEGWRIYEVVAYPAGEWRATAVPTPMNKRVPGHYGATATMWLGKSEHGATPAAALRALASLLADAGEGAGGPQ